MMLKMGLILTLICGFFYTAGDVFMKQWVTKPSWTYYLLSAGMYIVGMNFLAFSSHR